eukprot:CAMPEP_0119544450 /NCGR_PEP_ID=MMETSP1344-20130328/54738_1 /TAXON_ID=236787 /ORGANISM="Florenciella parvula, Strain CCMP2471" /LENGTH=415 /DNA_ID=CAMNT_0007588953 /DNA_START=1700 /DNA_END=2947 /DNA_ORIENTATION=+
MASVPVQSCTSSATKTTETLEWTVNGWDGLPRWYGEDGISTNSKFDSASTTLLPKTENMVACGENWQLAIIWIAGPTLVVKYAGSGSNVNIATKLSVTVVNQAGGTNSLKNVNRVHVFRGNANNGAANSMRPGFIQKFISSADLDDASKGYKVNDRVIIQIQITKYGAFTHTVATPDPTPASVRPPSTLETDIGALLKKGHGSDVAIYVADRTFNVHRTILMARSPYFQAYFANSKAMTGSGSGSGSSSSSSSSSSDASLEVDGIKISDTEPDVFEQLLKYMYNGKCDEGAIEAMCEHLLMAANHYQCDNLKLICQAKLHEGLTVANAAARLVLSEQMDAPKLKEICLAFIAHHAGEVMASEGWADVATYNKGGLVTEAFAYLAGVPVADSSKKRSAEEAGLSAGGQWPLARIFS